MSRPSRITIDDRYHNPAAVSAALTTSTSTAGASPTLATEQADLADVASLNSAESAENAEIDAVAGAQHRLSSHTLASGSRPGSVYGYASGYTTAVNTPAATEDKPFLFPSSAPISRATTRIDLSELGEDEKAKSGDIDVGANQTDKDGGNNKEGEGEGKDAELPGDGYVPELASYPLPEKKAMSKSRMIVLGAVMMSTTIVASATNSATLLTIPSTAADLGVTELQAQWVSSAYALANGCGLLFAGRLADLYGKKFLYLFGMALYIVLSIVSGVLRNYIGLCVVRAFAGLAISISLPAAFGIIGVTFTEEPYRTMAFSTLALGYPVGSGPGMIMAGLVAGINRHAWQYVFFVLAGLAFIPLVLGAFAIPAVPRKIATDKESANRRIDWLGAFLVTSALSLFSFSLTQSGLVDNGWKQPYIGACLGLSIVLILAFGVWEHVAETRTAIPPLVHLSIFSAKGWKVTAVLCVAFLGYLGISGWVYLTTIWYQNLKLETPLLNAVHMLPAPIVGMGACIIVPILAPRVRAPYLLAFGGLTTGIASMLFAVEPVSMTYWICSFLSNVFAPFGADFTVGIGSVLISNLVSEEQQSTAGALFQTALQIASTLGTCVCSLISTDVYQATGSLETGLKTAFWVMAAMSWVSGGVAVVTLRKVGLAMDVGKL